MAPETGGEWLFLIAGLAIGFAVVGLSWAACEVYRPAPPRPTTAEPWEAQPQQLNLPSVTGAASAEMRGLTGAASADAPWSVTGSPVEIGRGHWRQIGVAYVPPDDVQTLDPDEQPGDDND